jgi:hypothetical protein
MGEPDCVQTRPSGSGSGFIRKAPFGEWTEVNSTPFTPVALGVCSTPKSYSTGLVRLDKKFVLPRIRSVG